MNKYRRRSTGRVAMRGVGRLEATARRNGLEVAGVRGFGAHIGLTSLMCVRHRFQLLIKTGGRGPKEGYWSSRAGNECERNVSLGRRSGELLFGRPRSLLAVCLHAHDFLVRKLALPQKTRPAGRPWTTGNERRETKIRSHHSYISNELTMH